MNRILIGTILQIMGLTTLLIPAIMRNETGFSFDDMIIIGLSFILSGVIICIQVKNK